MRPSQTLQKVLTLSLLLASHLAPSLAETPTGTIRGTLVDEEKGWPIRGATVYLLGASREVRTQTDFKGRFAFTVPAGDYSGLAILRPGGEAVYEIEAPLPILEGIEDDLSEIPVPRPLSPSPEGGPVVLPPRPGTPSANGSAEGSAQSSPEGNSELSPSGSSLIPVLPPQPPSLPPLQTLPTQGAKEPQEVRAWLGVYMQDTTLQLDAAARPGPNTVIQVLRVFEGSPAERAQIREGDVLVTLDGRPLSKVTDLQKMLLDYKPGMKARFLLMRDGGFVETVVTLEEITDSLMQSLQPPPNQPPQEPAIPPIPPAPQFPPTPDGSPPSNQPSVPDPFPAPSPAAPIGSAPPPPPGASQVPPLIQEARQLSAQGLYLQASEKYDEHLRLYPNDGRAAAEQAEMVFFHIQNARGMALMAQAVKKQGLSVPEKTRLRMIIAQRRFESGNLVTAKQMLVEALREDPGNPDVIGLLDIIYQIEAAARAQQQVPYGPGQPRTELEIRLEKEFTKALEDLFD